MNNRADRAYAQRLEPGSLDLGEVVDFLLRRWKLICGCMFVAVSVTVASLYFVTPTYRASAQVLLESPREKVLGGEAVIADLILSSSIIESQLAILRSHALLRRVVEQEGLAEDPEFNGTEKGMSFPTLGQALQYLSLSGDDSGTPPVERRDTTAAAVKSLDDMLEVSRVGEANVIKITVNSSTPGRAAGLANAMASAYVDDHVAVRYDRAKRAAGWLNDRKAALRQQLHQSEAAVEEYRVRHNLVSTPAGSITEQQLSELSTALIRARAETAAKRASVEQLEKLLTSGADIQTLPEFLSAGLLPELRARLGELTQTDADLQSRYGERHPDVIKRRAERRELEAQIATELQRLAANLRNELAVAETREASLANSLAAVSGQSGTENQVAVELRELQRVAEADKEVYESFLARARIAEEESMLPTAEARIISPATAPNVPSSPHKHLLAAVAAVLGMAVGSGTAILLELLGPGFVARRQVEDLLALPVLGSLPMIRSWRRPRTDMAPLIQELNDVSFSRYTEAIRGVRVGLDGAIRGPGLAARAIQVTSALPEEGKTTLAISFAISAAAAGERVLLIDADLRLRAATELFGLDDRPGLVDLLTSSADVRDAVHLHEESGLYVLAAGLAARNPPALLSSARMRSLVSNASRTFDRVIIDSPPVAPAADAAALSRIGGSILFAVKWNDTPREAVEQAIMQLRAPERMLGIVLTMVDERKTPRYGRYLSLETKLLERYEVA